MAFRDFTFPQVGADLGVRITDADLFPNIAIGTVSPAVAEVVANGYPVATAVGTEKGKSEWLIAPVLLELRRQTGDEVCLFSGVEWDADPGRGLNGYCDFILTRGRTQHILRAPFAAVAEAKNDIIRTGFGQCIAAMVAARICNEREGKTARPVFGVVSTGTVWKFLRLVGDELQIDRSEYSITDLPRLMGVLRAMVDATA